MEVILLKDVPKVGQRNQIVTVSEGYAINFLIPRGMAKAATASAKKDLELIAGKQAQQASAEQAKVIEGIASIAGKTVSIHQKASEAGSLFAAITSERVAQAVHNELGVCLPESVFVVEPIKHIGTFEIQLFGGKAKSAFTLLVEREG